MTDTARTMPTDLQEVATRHHAARQITLEHAADSTTAPHVTASIWQQLAAAFADTPNLVAEITRLRADLAGARLDRANLATAALAAITAHHEGEPDPLSYLRDELRAQGHDPARSTR